MGDITQVFWYMYMRHLQISASIQSAINQFLKIQVTRTPFQIYFFKNQYLKRILLTGFSNIDNVYAENQQIMQKMVKTNC